MLDAAVSDARVRGVQTMAAYPVDAQGRRVDATAALVGTTAPFEGAGFARRQQTQARSGGLPRWLVRRDLSSRDIANRNLPAIVICRAYATGSATGLPSATWTAWGSLSLSV